MSWPGYQWPERDPYSYDGVRWLHKPLPPYVDIVVHSHTCPDGTLVECRSQWIPAVKRTVDRWWVGRYHVATSVRVDSNRVRPDFRWADARVTRPF
ncbi:hypothetical protein GCM10010174_25810 [Kutzneria viridogrisea]|uniref:Uncharacterized protein n=1 Tax=Kutzneria viridogrisea TaxID=47990 RepID=A0ABR6BRJ1_9PSEU|nr:hypothetical protein [Kutzneria viridogrisea]